jgi:hypothetical protein
MGGIMAFTQHAVVRMQQRGVSKEVLDLVLQFGRKEPRPGGAWKISMRKRDAANMMCGLKNMIHMIEKAQRKTAVVSGTDEVVITVYNR